MNTRKKIPSKGATIAVAKFGVSLFARTMFPRISAKSVCMGTWPGAITAGRVITWLIWVIRDCFTRRRTSRGVAHATRPPDMRRSTLSSRLQYPNSTGVPGTGAMRGGASRSSTSVPSMTGRTEATRAMPTSSPPKKAPSVAPGGASMMRPWIACCTPVPRTSDPRLTDWPPAICRCPKWSVLTCPKRARSTISRPCTPAAPDLEPGSHAGLAVDAQEELVELMPSFATVRSGPGAAEAARGDPHSAGSSRTSSDAPSTSGDV